MDAICQSRAARAALIAAGAVAATFGAAYAVANSPFLHRGPSGLGSCSTAVDVLHSAFPGGPNKAPLAEKVAIVTGCNSGIGLETARSLALFGAEVILPCRSMEKAEEALKDITEYCAARGVVACCKPMILDLNDLQSVRKFAQQIIDLTIPVHILINNAGIMALPERRQTVQGLEQQVGVCHVGHFLLTTLLLPVLKKSAPARVVCVSSIGHRFGTAEYLGSDLLERTEYTPWGAYGDAKLSNILFAREFNKRYADEGVTAYSLHPGGIHTNLQGHVSFAIKVKWAVLTPFFFKSIAQGAATSVFCATHPLALPDAGKYFVDCNVGKTDTEDLVNDPRVSSLLWVKTESLVGHLAEEDEEEQKE